MNLRSIEIFVAVVEGDGMSRAAERLAMTQSAVSQAVASLENAVGKQLIDRSMRPVKVTLAGTSFYQKAKELLDRARELEQLVELDLNNALPLLRIGMVDSFASTAGPHLVRELGSITSRWSVESGIHETTLRALIERRVDFVITPDDSYYDAEVIAIPVFEEPFLIVAPADTKKSVERIINEDPLIRYSPQSFIGQQVDAFLKQQSFPCERRYEFDTSDAVMAMVAAGIGWSITTPLSALRSPPPMQQVGYHPLPNSTMRRKLWLMARYTESPELARRIAAAARNAVTVHCLPQILMLAPWLKSELSPEAGKRRGPLSLSGRARRPVPLSFRGEARCGREANEKPIARLFGHRTPAGGWKTTPPDPEPLPGRGMDEGRSTRA